MTPDVLLVGHIAKDITDDGWRAGGSVLYAAAQCRKLGLNVAVVTACGPEIDPPSLLPDVSWHVVPDMASTTFENRYEGDERTQLLLDRARPITIVDVPEEWQEAPIVQLMPIFHDVDVDMVSTFSCSATILGLSVQGWLRQLDITTIRRPEVIPDGRAWHGADVLFLSEEDLRVPEAAAEWAPYVPTIVLTRAGKGLTVWKDSCRTDFAGFPVEAVDPTGAGDVFASAFTVRLHETGDATEAARFASAAAALSVQGRGVEAVASREAIDAFLRREAA